MDVPLIAFDTAGVDRRQDVCSSGLWVPCGALEAPEGAADFILDGDWGKPVAGALQRGAPVYLMQASCGTDTWNKPGSNSNLVMDWTKERSTARANACSRSVPSTQPKTARE
jgi:hypothetical protein